MKKVLILREKFKHMGSHSGYDLLFNFNENNRDIHIKSLYLSPKGRPFWFKVLQKLGFKTAMSDYTFNQYVLGWKTYLYTLFFHPALIHCTFVEENLRFLQWRPLAALIKKRVAIIGTVHQPFSYWQDRKETNLLHQFDGLVLLNNNLISYFRQQFPEVKLFEVPHPVDTQYFKKTIQPSHPAKRCLFIGYWLRDFDCLFDTIRRSVDRNAGVYFDLVIPIHGMRKLKDKLEQLPVSYVTIHSGISDDALLQLLNTDTCLFLPLKDFTANNSLLEGMSCELPVIVAANNQQSMYFQQGLVKLFTPDNTDAIIDFIEI